MNPAEFAQLASHEERLWWFRGMRRIADLMLDRHCSTPAGARILEAGCGTGFEAARMLRGRGWNITPLDLSPVAATSARHRGLSPVIGGITSLPFPDRVFDGVISLDVIVHLDDPGQGVAIAEFARVLAPGGWLFIRAAALNVLRSRHSQYVGERCRVRLSCLKACVESCGLRVQHATYANSLLLPVAFLKFRVWEPLTNAPPASGVNTPSPWLNSLLEIPLSIEHSWLSLGGHFPLGQSALLVARKPV